MAGELPGEKNKLQNLEGSPIVACPPIINNYVLKLFPRSNKNNRCP
jgi:hypothetical protein